MLLPQRRKAHSRCFRSLSFPVVSPRSTALSEKAARTVRTPQASARLSLSIPPEWESTSCGPLRFRSAQLCTRRGQQPVGKIPPMGDNTVTINPSKVTITVQFADYQWYDSPCNDRLGAVSQLARIPTIIRARGSMS